MQERPPQPDQTEQRLLLIQGGVPEQGTIDGQAPAIPPATAGEHAANGAREYSEIADLVNIDKSGRGHITSYRPNGRSRSGQFTSRYEMEQIVANRDLIRDNPPKKEDPVTPPQKPPKPDAPDQGSQPSGPDGGGPDEPDLDFMRQFPEDMAYDLATSLNKWTKLAAARERSIITLQSGEVGKDKVEVARQNYEELRRQAKGWTNDKMEELGLEPAERVMISKLEDMTEAKLAGLGIKMDAEILAELKGPLAGMRKNFYDWWACQGGGGKFFSRQRLVGTAKKAAVMGVIGLPVGIAAGVAGVFLAGPLAGAAVAAGVGRGVARGLARGHIEKNAAAKSVATAQYETRLADQHEKIDAAYTGDGKPESVTDVYAEGTNNGVRRNRRRVMGSIAIGAVAGIGGAYIGELAHNALWGGHAAPAKPALAPHHPAVHHPAVHHPAGGLHGATGQEFNVEQGSGEIREIQEYASAHHYSVTPNQADQIYNQMYAEHGSKLINLAGSGPDTYVIHPGDVGLSHPGEAHWYPGIEDELRDRLAKDAE
jgi:hypothetical protein